MRALSSVLTGLFADTEIYSNKAVVYVWKRPCFVSIVNLDSNLKQEQFLQRPGAIYKWISLTLDCFIKRFWLDRTQLNDPIHIPAFFTRQCFPFSQKQKSKISMFSGATRVTDWVSFFFLPLVRLPTGTKWHRKELFQGKERSFTLPFLQPHLKKCWMSLLYILYKHINCIQVNIFAERSWKKRSTLYNPNQQMHLQAVLIPSSTEIYIWPQPFAVTSWRCSELFAAGKGTHGCHVPAL